MSVMSIISAGDPFLRSKHALAPWINLLLFVELTCRLIRNIDDSHQWGLDTVRSILWGILVVNLAWRFLCQNPAMWWSLDYVPTLRNSLVWLLRCPEWSLSSVSYGIRHCLRVGENVGTCWSFNMLGSRIVEFLSPRPQEEEDEEEPLAPPAEQLMDREVELTESRHDKHA